MNFEKFRKAALMLLESCQPMKAVELSEAIGANYASAYQWLKKMVAAGDITKVGKSYVLPDYAPSETVETEPVETEPEEVVKPVVVVEPLPRASMTTSKPKLKLAAVTPITPAKPAIAPYLQEQQAENHWAFILRHANVSDGMETQANVNRLANASNWNVFSEGLDLCSAGLMAVQQIAGNYQAYLENKAKKGASAISLHDVQVFVADKIWEAKLTNDAILNPALKLQAQFWQTDRTYRARLHEALIKSGKWFLTEVNALMSLSGGGLSKEQLDTYLKQYGDRQQAFLDELLNSRQAQAKRIVAEEIGNAVNINQLPEAK